MTQQPARIWRLNWPRRQPLREASSGDSGAGRKALFAAFKRWRLARHAQRLGKDVRISGRLKIINEGTLEIGDRCGLSADYQPLRLSVGRGAVLRIGAGTTINSAIIAARRAVTIGKDCRLAPFVHFMDSDFHDTLDRLKEGKADPIHVGDGVRLGAHTLVLRGVTIGAGAELLPGSVVTKDIPAGALAGGVPARVITSDG